MRPLVYQIPSKDGEVQKKVNWGSGGDGKTNKTNNKEQNKEHEIETVILQRLIGILVPKP